MLSVAHNTNNPLHQEHRGCKTNNVLLSSNAETQIYLGIIPQVQVHGQPGA